MPTNDCDVDIVTGLTSVAILGVCAKEPAASCVGRWLRTNEGCIKPATLVAVTRSVGHQRFQNFAIRSFHSQLLVVRIMK